MQMMARSVDAGVRSVTSGNVSILWLDFCRVVSLVAFPDPALQRNVLVFPVSNNSYLQLLTKV
jgi:hypothetical protein